MNQDLLYVIYALMLTLYYLWQLRRYKRMLKRYHDEQKSQLEELKQKHANAILKATGQYN